MSNSAKTVKGTGVCSSTEVPDVGVGFVACVSGIGVN